MKTKTRNAITGYLEGFIQGFIEEHKEKKPGYIDLVKRKMGGEIKPFHEAILPEALLKINAFERSFSTKLGTTFEEVARLIAVEKFSKSERAHKVIGQISPHVIKFIESTANGIDRNGMTANYVSLASKTASLSRKMVLGESRKMHSGSISPRF